MVSCEKCWKDAYTRSRCKPEKRQAEHYRDLLEERKDHPCTPQEQAGEFWDEEKQCDSRFPATQSLRPDVEKCPFCGADQKYSPFKSKCSKCDEFFPCG